MRKRTVENDSFKFDILKPMIEQNLPFLTISKNLHGEDHDEKLNVLERDILKEMIADKHKQIRQMCYKVTFNINRFSFTLTMIKKVAVMIRTFKLEMKLWGDLLETNCLWKEM